jgi:hypothetical protein
MTTLTSTDPRVVSFFNHYHEKVKSRPSLYTNQRDGNKGILVSLPRNLIDYAERTAGHHGFGQSAMPVGICRKVDNAKKSLTDIFSSTESLTKFINSSARDAEAYINEVRQRAPRSKIADKLISKSTTDDRMVKDVFFEKYTINDAKTLQVKFGRNLVISDFNTLTINEFELRYGLGI